jgi:transferase hexapeptide repeat containing protein
MNMIQNNFYTDKELQECGFKSIGNNVKISKKASIYKPELMSIGDNVRIEDFCVLNGHITIGNNVLLCVFCLLDGHAGITIEDNVTFAAKVSVHSGSDDYSGASLFGSYIPVTKRLKHVNAPVLIKQHSLIADSVVIMPGCILEEGSAIGAFSFVKKSTLPWGIYAGIPARRIRERKNDVAFLYADFLKECKNGY